MNDEILQDGLKEKSKAEKEEEDIVTAFHVSIGWALKAPEEGASEKLKNLGADSKGFEIRVDNVKVKMGNGISVIPLTENRDSSNGIIES